MYNIHRGNAATTTLPPCEAYKINLEIDEQSTSSDIVYRSDEVKIQRLDEEGGGLIDSLHDEGGWDGPIHLQGFLGTPGSDSDLSTKERTIVYAIEPNIRHGVLQTLKSLLEDSFEATGLKAAVTIDDEDTANRLALEAEFHKEETFLPNRPYGMLGRFYPVTEEQMERAIRFLMQAHAH